MNGQWSSIRPFSCKVISTRDLNFAQKERIKTKIFAQVNEPTVKNPDTFYVSTYWTKEWGSCVLFSSFARERGFTPRPYDIIKTDIIRQGNEYFCKNMVLHYRRGERTVEQRARVKELNLLIDRSRPGAERRTFLRQALDEFPDDKYFLTGIAAELLEHEAADPFAASPYVERALCVAPVDQKVIALAGKHALRLWDHKKAKTYAYLLNKLEPEHYYAYYLYGELARRDGNSGLAEVNFKKCLFLKQDDTAALVGLASIAAARKDHAQMRIYNEMISMIRNERRDSEAPWG